MATVYVCRHGDSHLLECIAKINYASQRLNLMPLVADHIPGDAKVLVQQFNQVERVVNGTG